MQTIDDVGYRRHDVIAFWRHSSVRRCNLLSVLRRRRLAALGAGVIAAGATSTPAPVAVPQTASPNVALGALADLLPPPSVGSQALLAIGDAIAFGAGVAVAPAVAVCGALPPLPLVPPNVQLSLLTGTPNLGAGNNGDFNVGLNNTGSRNFGNNNIGALNFGSGNEGALNGGINNVGAGNVGVGNQGVANVGFFNQGSGKIGAFNTTNNNIGVANIGIRNPLGPAASSAVGSQAAAKQTNATVGAKKSKDD
ncbi:MAG: hypothetical protein QOJ24_3327 [Mycobacterium sp.]|nr:hypothetical protein [Mycobacterium sp.]